MPAQPGPRFDEMSRRWLDLAERRLVYFAGLYQSGRWRRYYTPQVFAAHLADAMKAVTIWRALAAQAPAGRSDLRPAA
ncbi:MAG: TIGR03809 family protein [Pseudolabrys sp.]